MFPNERFGRNHVETLVGATNWIVQADRSKFVCANGQHLLLGDSLATSWPSADCDRFLRALVKFWNEWT
jgi:hypothetical protein